jgi:anaphase-promoting complex subunit 1
VAAPPPSDVAPATNAAQLGECLRRAHLCYEDSKLNILLRNDTEQLATFLQRLASAAGRPSYVDHYARDTGRCCVTVAQPDDDDDDDDDVPFNVFEVLKRLLAGERVDDVPGELPERCQRLMCLYAALGSDDADAPSLVLAMVDDGWTAQSLESLPVGVCLPLREVVATVRSDPPPGWPARAYRLIGRIDLIESGGEHNVDVRAADVSALIFAQDRRLDEVRQLLRSDIPIALRQSSEVGMSDHELLQHYQQRLVVLAQRQTALAVGRGMLTLGTEELTLGKTVRAPALDLSAMLRASKQPIRLDQAGLPPTFTGWADFHNGAAAGLSVRGGEPIGAGRHLQRAAFLTTFFERPEQPNDTHAGLLMALGLQGHLKALPLTQVFDYLADGHARTSIGLLLGLAAAHAGTMDTAISKILTVHVPALLPPSSTSLDMAPSLQTAALAAFGLLYRGTCHRRIVDVLLEEIRRPPGDDSATFERESHSLAAGLALGMVTLGRGGNIAALTDLRVDQRLLELMTGLRGGNAAFDDGAFGNDDGVDDDDNDVAADLDADAPLAGCGGPAARGGAHSSLVLEPHVNYINVDVTAPAAVVALGLMFLKTGNEAIAAQLDVPNTHYMLEHVRPTVVMLRVLAKQLVLWHSVEPTDAWLRSQMPPMLIERAARMRSTKRSLDIDDDDDDDDDEMTRLPHVHSIASRRGTELQAFTNAVAGLCLALGFRFAGSFDERAAALLSSELNTMCAIRRVVAKQSSRDPTSLSLIMTDGCVAAVALALSMVLAGSGHLPTLLMIRALAKERMADREVTYGVHMALHMAIGLLFLGGGTRTLSTSNESIAALLCAVYPSLPVAPADQRYHLQALRHLYVLAAGRHCVVTRDVDTGEPVFCPLDVDAANGATMRVMSPCLLPPLDTLRCIRVASPRYWSSTHAEPRSHVIAVKRKTGHLRYATDPSGKRSILSRTLLASTDDDLLRSFSADPRLVAFARYFARDVRQRAPSPPLIHRPMATHAEPASFAKSALYECISRDKPELIATYLRVHRTLHELDLGTLRSSLAIADLGVMVHYYECTLLRACARPRLVDEVYVALVSEALARHWRARIDSGALVDYFKRGRIASIDLASFLVAERMPRQAKHIERFSLSPYAHSLVKSL